MKFKLKLIASLYSENFQMVAKIKNVSKMIFDALVLDVKEEKQTLLGAKLKQAAEDSKSKLKGPSEENLEDEEIASNMKRLKVAEENNNLSWVPFSSWKSMPADLKTEMTEDLNPVTWNGNVYFLWNEFIEFRVKYVQMLRGKACFAILKDSRTYKIIFNAFGSHQFAGRSAKHIREETKKFNENLIEVFGSNKGKFIRSYFLGEDVELTKPEEVDGNG